MKHILIGLLAISLCLAFAPAPASAHHSMSMYNRDRVTTLKGTVTLFDWSNPHCKIYFDTKADNGAVVKWSAEMGGPGRMSRNGWNKDSLKPGDEITIYGNPNKDGSPTMRVEKVVLPNGQQIGGYR